MIAVVEKMRLEDKVEERRQEGRKRKKMKKEKKKEKKKVRVWDLKQINSSRGPGLGKVHQLPSWSLS